MILIQRGSQIPYALALNSASALEWATTDCLLLLQVIRSPPKKVQYLVVDRLSIIDPIQPNLHLCRLPT